MHPDRVVAFWPFEGSEQPDLAMFHWKTHLTCGIQPQPPYLCDDNVMVLPNRDRGRFVGRLPSQGLPWVVTWIDERSGVASRR